MKKLSVFTLMMINVSAILSLRSLPGYAEYGYALITYLSLAALCFFIPSALVAAELASAWKGRGGVYLWVKEAFGPKWGFLAIFMQWVENLPWFPAVLAFAASDVAYVVDPALAQSKLFTVGVIIGSLWLSTLLNLRDMKLSAFFSSSGAVLGAIIPGVVIIGLGVWGLSTHVDAQLTFGWKALAPDFHNAQQLMLLAAMLVSFQGMEMSAVHVNEVDRPGKNYPRAIFAASAIILVVAVLGGLAIAEVVPAAQLSLSAGVCQAFEKLFAIHNTPVLTPIFSFFMAYGALAMVATWMVGPSKGLLEVAKEGMLPRSWRAANKYGMPTGILLIQASLSSLVSLAILFMPTVSSAFMLMTALAAQLYLVMYLLMFAAAIRLRYKHPEVRGDYRIPGGKPGIWIVCSLALLTSAFVFVVGFIPPSSVMEEGVNACIAYAAFLLAGVAGFTLLPLYFHARASRSSGYAQDVGEDA